MIRGFERDFSDAARDLELCIESQRWTDAQRLAHTLKGVAKSIGANELHARASGLESELASQQYFSLEKTKEALAATLHAVADLPSYESSIPVMADRARLGAIVAEMHGKLKHSMFVDPVLVEELTRSLGAAPATLICRKLQSQLERFEYKAACITLRELSAMCQITLEG